MKKTELIKKVDLFQYIFLNYFCKNVIRKGKGKIIPYKHSVFSFEPGSKIILRDDSLETNDEQLPGSKTETLIRLRKNAVWEINGPCMLNYGCTIEILEKGRINSQYFTMNSNSTIVCAKQISIGNDVMIGRDVVIYDSDFHDIRDKNMNCINPSEGVIVGDHVWIGTNSIILKNTEIGDNCIISAGSALKGKVENNTTFYEHKKLLNKGKWIR